MNNVKVVIEASRSIQAAASAAVANVSASNALIYAANASNSAKEATNSAAAAIAAAADVSAAINNAVAPSLSAAVSNATSAAATSATNSATSATSAEANANSAANSANAANLAAQSLADYNYATYAAMTADLTPAAGKKALVYNDSSNNGIYIKQGASGTGSWQKSTYVPPVVDGAVTTSKLNTTAIGDISVYAQSIFTPLTLDQNKSDSNFKAYLNRFYAFNITIPMGLNGVKSPRLFISRIGVKSSDSADANNITIDISSLSADNTYAKIAEVNIDTMISYTSNYDTLKFVEYNIVGVGAYAGLISGKLRWERENSWNYFYANGVQSTQINRVYSIPSPTFGALEIRGDLIKYSVADQTPDGSFPIAKLQNRAVAKMIQGSQSIFAQTTIEQNKDDSTFINHVNRFFDFSIKIPNAIDAKPYKRLFITAINSIVPKVEISYLNLSNTFVKIAEGVLVDASVNTNQFDYNSKFVEYQINGVDGYENRISGMFKWERLEGWNYYYNNGIPITYSDSTPHIGSYEISQNVIEYYDDLAFKPLPNEPSYNGLLKQLPNFYSHYLKADKDLVVIGVGESIFTANNYTSDRTDATTRPPLCHENNLFSYIEEKLRWKGQEYRRFDASSTFTEIATTKVTSEYDNAWDWQVGYGVSVIDENFKPAITRILDGANVSVSYSYPANMRRCNFIYRTDYLCAPNTSVTIAEGNGKVEVFDEATQGWVEANGYIFSAKEIDNVIDYTRTDYNGTSHTDKLRKSVYQKRLKMRSLSVLTVKTVTITNNGPGRLCYWGIEYSPRSNMIYLLNQARGGHDISRLRAFETWDIDGFKPDLILHQTNIINEGAMSAPNMPINNKPADFAQRFLNYANALKAKSYAPEFLAFTMYVGSQANIVDTGTGKYNSGYITGYGDVTVFDYIGNLDAFYSLNNIIHINMFYEFLAIAEQKAAAEGTNNIWTSAILGSGISGNTFTIDNVHPNDYGNNIAKILLLPLFKFLS